MRDHRFCVVIPLWPFAVLRRASEGATSSPSLSAAPSITSPTAPAAPAAAPGPWCIPKTTAAWKKTYTELRKAIGSHSRVSGFNSSSRAQRNSRP